MVRMSPVSQEYTLMVRSLGQLIKILRQSQMEVVVDKLIDFSGGKDEELRDISALGAIEVFVPFLLN